MRSLQVSQLTEDAIGPFVLTRDTDQYDIVVWRRDSTLEVDDDRVYAANGIGRWIVLETGGSGAVTAEEGDWTDGTLKFDGIEVNYLGKLGYFYKIGRLVYLFGTFIFTNSLLGVNDIELGNLPFNAQHHPVPLTPIWGDDSVTFSGTYLASDSSIQINPLLLLDQSQLLTIDQSELLTLEMN